MNVRYVLCTNILQKFCQTKLWVWAHCTSSSRSSSTATKLSHRATSISYHPSYRYLHLDNMHKMLTTLRDFQYLSRIANCEFIENTEYNLTVQLTSEYIPINYPMYYVVWVGLHIWRLWFQIHYTNYLQTRLHSYRNHGLKLRVTRRCREWFREAGEEEQNPDCSGTTDQPPGTDGD